jgi:hypothetical protein
MGKLLIILGIILIGIGLVVSYADRIPFLGKLPGDVRIEKENFSFYFPFTTSIILSIALSIIIYIINRLRS